MPKHLKSERLVVDNTPGHEAFVALREGRIEDAANIIEKVNEEWLHRTVHVIRRTMRPAKRPKGMKSDPPWVECRVQVLAEEGR